MSKWDLALSLPSSLYCWQNFPLTLVLRKVWTNQKHSLWEHSSSSSSIPSRQVIGAPQMISQPVSSIFLFSTALWDMENSRPVHFLMLSSHLFFCLPCQGKTWEHCLIKKKKKSTFLRQIWPSKGAALWVYSLPVKIKKLAHDVIYTSMPHTLALFITPHSQTRLLDTKWQCSWLCFHGFEKSVFNKLQTINQLKTKQTLL